MADFGWREQLPHDQKTGLAVGVGTAVLTALCFAIRGMPALQG